MASLPKRSRKFGVGKEIGGAIYVHRDYQDVLAHAVSRAKLQIPADFKYAIVKYMMATQTSSFIDSPDFDFADEPIVGDLFIVKNDGTIKKRKQLQDPYIYHHKWLFVADNYRGFDVEVSKLRSLAWLALENVDKTRIGRKSYWERQVVSRLLHA